VRFFLSILREFNWKFERCSAAAGNKWLQSGFGLQGAFDNWNPRCRLNRLNISGGFSNVSVRNCTILNFTEGIYLNATNVTIAGQQYFE